MSLPEDAARVGSQTDAAQGTTQAQPTQASAPSSTSFVPTIKALQTNGETRRESAPNVRSARRVLSPEPAETQARTPPMMTPEPQIEQKSSDESVPHTELDYEAAVNALTLQFLHEHEATRVAALAWLIMLHRKSPRRILAIQDATFPALLKTLSDPAEAVVT
ncbi:hypothetical protein KC346_g23186, partial [Hortaea werneckii]